MVVLTETSNTPPCTCISVNNESPVITVHQIELPAPGLTQLQTDARNEGYKFIETLVKQWSTGENRFDAPGEVLCGCTDEGLLVAVGGLTRDPFTTASDVGRIRRVYVRPAWRNRGFGRALVTSLVEHARKKFRYVRLRAENPSAARLYERIGFIPSEESDATHVLSLINS
jgi:GNAT superfamily N-acetyltransferase